jgi:hypothetical protein
VNSDWLNLLGASPLIIVKWFTVVGLMMYSFFAAVVIKQVGVMTETVESEINGIVVTFAWVHFALALFLVGVALIYL